MEIHAPTALQIEMVVAKELAKTGKLRKPDSLIPENQVRDLLRVYARHWSDEIKNKSARLDDDRSLIGETFFNLASLLGEVVVHVAYEEMTVF